MPFGPREVRTASPTAAINEKNKIKFISKQKILDFIFSFDYILFMINHPNFL
jgi:hypothetical protein